MQSHLQIARILGCFSKHEAVQKSQDVPFLQEIELSNENWVRAYIFSRGNRKFDLMKLHLETKCYLEFTALPPVAKHLLLGVL